LCKWLENTSWALAVSGAFELYPYIRLLHFTGLMLFISTTAVVDLRLLGWGRHSLSADQLFSQVRAWNWIGLAVTFAGGFLLFIGTASGYIINPAFQIKMLALLALIGLRIIIQQKSPAWGRAANVPVAGKLAAGFELVLWVGMILAAVRIPSSAY
jgi:hypothetical protein